MILNGPVSNQINAQVSCLNRILSPYTANKCIRPIYITTLHIYITNILYTFTYSWMIVMIITWLHKIYIWTVLMTWIYSHMWVYHWKSACMCVLVCSICSYLCMCFSVLSLVLVSPSLSVSDLPFQQKKKRFHKMIPQLHCTFPARSWSPLRAIGVNLLLQI